MALWRPQSAQPSAASRAPSVRTRIGPASEAPCLVTTPWRVDCRHADAWPLGFHHDCELISVREAASVRALVMRRFRAARRVQVILGPPNAQHEILTTSVESLAITAAAVDTVAMKPTKRARVARSEKVKLPLPSPCKARRAGTDDAIMTGRGGSTSPLP
jgi:hypothetical protein